jgi:serine/threonine protein kinase
MPCLIPSFLHNQIDHFEIQVVLSHFFGLLGTVQDQRHWTAKVADFGLSRVLEGVDQIQTHTFGTVTHMPPEMLVEGRMTKAADVYAFGVIMW